MRAPPILAALALLTTACAPPLRTPAPTDPPAPGTLTVHLDEALPWPMRLTTARFVADGALIRPNHRVSAVPGTHVAMLRAEVRWACSPAGNEAVATVFDMVAVEVGAGGAEVRWSLIARGSRLDRPEERLAVERRVHGDVQLATARAPDELALAAERCGTASGPEAAGCRVRVLVDRARERRDLIDLLCKSRKLQALHELSPVDPASTVRAAQLEREAEACVGEDIAHRASSVRINQPCPDED